MLAALRRRRFVGRVAELQAFLRWLDGSSSADRLLEVTGPGGIGKTWLVRQCCDVATARGWTVQWLDVATADGSGPAALADLTGSSGDTADQAGSPVLLVLDSVDADVSALRGILDLVAPAVADGSRVLMTSRVPLRPLLGDWAALTKSIPLTGLTNAERDAYLLRRGLEDPAQRVAVTAVGGHPLVLALAADLVTDLAEDLAAVGARPAVANVDTLDIRSAPQWGRSLTAIVEQLTGTASGVLPLLQAAAVARRVDRSLLAAVRGADADPADFSRLSASSSVRAVPGGLALHDDLRAAVTDHLRWSDPSMLRELQTRAVRHLQERLSRAAGRDDEARLGGDILYVLRDVLGLTGISFDQAEDGLVVDDVPVSELRSVLRSTGSDPAAHLSATEYRELWRALELPGARATIVTDARRTLRAYSAVVPLTAAAVAELSAGHRLGLAAEAALVELGLDRLPETVEDCNLWHYTIGAAPPGDLPVRVAMFWEIMTLLSRGGAYVVFETTDMSGLFLDEWRTLDVPARALDGALAARLGDYSRSSIGVRFAALLDARPVVGAPRDLVAAVSEVVAAWEDDAALARAPLADAVVPHTITDAVARAAALRAELRRALTDEAPIPSLRRRLAAALTASGLTGLPPDPPGLPSDPPTEYVIRLQGRTQIARWGEPLPVPEGIILTAVKVVALAGKIGTDQLLETLWPDTDPTAGRTRLRTLLARLRRVAPELLLRDGDTLRLGDVTVDAVRFVDAVHQALPALSRGDLGPARAALALHAGELLPTDRDADWAERPRRDYERQALALFDALAAALAAQADVPEAVEVLERAIAIRPDDEFRYARAATLLLDAGRGGPAREMVRRGLTRLRDLDLPPGPELTRLARQVGP